MFVGVASRAIFLGIRKLRPYPTATGTTSPAFPKEGTFSIKMTFIYSSKTPATRKAGLLASFQKQTQSDYPHGFREEGCKGPPRVLAIRRSPCRGNDYVLTIEKDIRAIFRALLIAAVRSR